MALEERFEVDTLNSVVIPAPEIREPRRGMFIACLWALLFLFIIDMVIYWVGTGGKMKVEANKILSPWDISAAPPQFLHPNRVRITSRIIENTKINIEKPRRKWSRRGVTRRYIALRKSDFQKN